MSTTIYTSTTIKTKIGLMSIENALNKAVETSSPDFAASIVDDLYKNRHDIFGEYVSDALSIPIRDDCDASTIYNFIPDKYIIDNDISALEDILTTPDNFWINEEKLEIVLIDYKVGSNMSLIIETIHKYKEDYRILESLTSLKVKVCVVMFHVNSGSMIIEPSIDLIPFIRPPTGELYNLMNGITEVIKTIQAQWESNEVFASQMYGYNVTKGNPWVKNKDCADFWDSEEWKELRKTLQDTQWLSFIEQSIEEIPTSKLKQGMANESIINGSSKYDSMIEKESSIIIKNIKENNPAFSKVKNPTRDVLEKSWSDLNNIYTGKFDTSMDVNNAKPTIHCTWAPDSDEVSRLFESAIGEHSNIKKIMLLSVFLRTIDGGDMNSKILRMLGRSMDLGTDTKEAIKLYQAHLDYKKEESLEMRKKRRIYVNMAKKGLKENVPIEKGKKIQIGNAIINNSQQFKFTSMVEYREAKKECLRMAHVGGYINYKNTTEEFIKNKILEDDGSPKKVKLINFNDPEIVVHCKQIIEHNHKILSENVTSKILRGDTDSILESLNIDKSSDMYQYYQWMVESNYYKASLDIGDLVLNAMKMGFNSDRNYFRCLVSGSKSTFLILLPSDSIVSRNSTICYITITFHKKNDLLNLGAEYTTKKLTTHPDLYVTMSKPMRLDKPRIKKLFLFKYYFQLSTLSMISETKIRMTREEFMNVCKINFHMCGSVSKSLMSLTEPCRYIMMNSFSLCSDVYGYITDKFDPRPKTWFSAYIVNKIKEGSLKAFDNRKELSLLDLRYDNDLALKFGVSSDPTLDSLWFDKKCNLKEYLIEIYTPFYLNSKDLHNYSSNIIQLIKVPIEIENMLTKEWTPWGQGEKQKVDLDVFIPSICHYYSERKFKMNKTRSMIESKNNFTKKIFSIDTMTSSKSCIVHGSETEDTQNSSGLKEDLDIMKKNLDIKRQRLKNAGKRVKSKYEEFKTNQFIDIHSNKVFDELFKRVQANPKFFDRNFIEIAFEIMRDYKEIYMSLFAKQQRTYTDREIYLGEFELKMCLYVLERIYKEQCSEDVSEQISNPGDSKMKTLQQERLSDMKSLSVLLEKNKEIHDDGTILEINADMSKWSAQDVTYKYAILVAIDPNLFPGEKKMLIKFIMRYTKKKLIIPNQAMEILKNQFEISELEDGDILRKALDNFEKNSIVIRQNWLQGNLNYISSFVHSICAGYMKDVMENVFNKLGCEAKIKSLVHSDDNQTTCIVTYPNVPVVPCNEIDVLNQFSLSRILMYGFDISFTRFGHQVNKKKTNINEIIKEFVSLINLHGDCFSIYPRFVLPSVGDCAFLGPYEDLASRLSSIRSALKHGCSMELSKIGIAVSTICSYNTYSMLKNQENDPILNTPFEDRSRMPIELGGYPNFDLGLFIILGMESQDITAINRILCKSTKESFRRNPQQEHYDFDVDLLDNDDILYAKYIRNYMLDAEITAEQNLGETYDLKSRSIITPRLFSTIKVFNKLESYKSFNELQKNNPDQILDYIIAKPYLAIGKAENSEEYGMLCRYRYYSRRFKESLSIQNSNQLFIEQFLQSKARTIDKESIKNIDMLRLDEDDTDGISLVGRISIKECLQMIGETIKMYELDAEDLEIIMNHKINLEPTVTTCVNTLNLFEAGIEREVNFRYVTRIEQLATIRNIMNTPANILRYYITRDMNSVNNTSILEETLKSDLARLETFVEETNLEKKLELKLERLEQERPGDKKNLMFIITKKMQTLYGYLSQNQVRQNYIMLGSRSERNPQSFINNVFMCTRKENVIVMNNSNANVLSMQAKGTIARNKQNHRFFRMQLLGSVLTFMNDYINRGDHETFLNTMLESSEYQGVKLREIAISLGETESNRLTQPGLFSYLKMLKDSDIDILRAGNSGYTVVFTGRQLDNALNIGQCKFQIYNTRCAIDILVEDSKIMSMKIRVYNQRHADCSLELNKALRFAKYKKGIQTGLFLPSESLPGQANDRNRYVWVRKYMRKGKEQIEFKVKTKYEIGFINEDIVRRNIGVGPDQVYKFLSTIKIENRTRAAYDVRTIRNMNMSSESILKYKIDNDQDAPFRRAHVSHLKDLDIDPNIMIEDISLKKLLSSPILTKRIKDLERTDFTTFASLFQCSGKTNDIKTFKFFGIDSTTDEKEMTFKSHLIPSISTTSKGSDTYREALSRIAISKIFDFEETTMVIRDDMEMCSLKNIKNEISMEHSKVKKYIDVIIQITELAKTKLWSLDDSIGDVDRILMNYLHYYYKTFDQDYIFHSNDKIPRKLFANEMDLDLDISAVKFLVSSDIRLIYRGMDILGSYKKTIKTYIESMEKEKTKNADPLDLLEDDDTPDQFDAVLDDSDNMSDFDF